MNDDVVLRARDLVVERAGTPVLHGVDLELRRGEVVALLGPNGAGKTTLLAALAGLVNPAGGEIDRHGRVAAVLQSPDLARGTARANVDSALRWWGVPRNRRAAPADAALAAVGAEKLAHRPARALSGGEQRRVHLARALAVRPDALLLDEPFAGLDAATRGELLYDAASALRDPKRATLVIVHDRAEAWALADRLLVMLDGQIVADGPPAQLLERPPSIAVAEFLGFDGRIEQEDTVLLVRAAQVQLDPGGPLTATVARTIPVEDGVRVELVLRHGRLWTVTDPPGPALGSTVGVRTRSAIAFSRDGDGRAP